jgi:hypothetical protein
MPLQSQETCSPYSDGCGSARFKTSPPWLCPEAVTNAEISLGWVPPTMFSLLAGMSSVTAVHEEERICFEHVAVI